tara:strand:- start:102 stop:386 length:285 start_codon:yes stop_codon:yes gene_type:complete
MRQEIKRKLIAKTLMAFMTIFYTVTSIGLCMCAGYHGIELAKSHDISKWWIVLPLLIFTIALISYLETMGWYEKYYKSPRRKLEKWAGIRELPG